jgi:hypothetical protein
MLWNCWRYFFTALSKDSGEMVNAKEISIELMAKVMAID